MNRRICIQSILAGIAAFFLSRKSEAAPIGTKYGYKEVEPDKEFFTESGKHHPVATLADSYGGRVQIAIDDSCYVLYLKQPDGKYKRNAYWFSQAHAVVSKLPDPMT